MPSGEIHLTLISTIRLHGLASPLPPTLSNTTLSQTRPTTLVMTFVQLVPHHHSRALTMCAAIVMMCVPRVKIWLSSLVHTKTNPQVKLDSNIYVAVSLQNMFNSNILKNNNTNNYQRKYVICIYDNILIEVSWSQKRLNKMKIWYLEGM